MNWDQVEGQWQNVKGHLREKWGKLTDSDWEQIGGKKDRFLGALQNRYGHSKEESERELDTFLKDFEDTSATRANNSHLS